MDGSALAGTSGIKYAFILSNGENAHDAWAISPAVYMTGGTEYKIEFNTVILTFGSIKESFEVAVGSSPDVQSMTMVLGSVDDTEGDWQKKKFLFTPENSGEYYIGFHSNSPVASKDDAGTLIDDLKVYTGQLPVIGGLTPCDLGVHGNLDAAAKGTVEIENRGSGDLELTLKDASENLMIEGLPMVIDRFETGSFDVTLIGAEIGDYYGEIVLATNDPLHPEVTVEVTAEIEESRVTGFNIEDFESGGPMGWELPMGVVNTADLAGHNSSRCIYTTTYYTMFADNQDGIGFTTHYVDMGEAPVFSFWYQLTDNSMFGGAGNPTDSERPIVKVFVSDDYGITWNKEYEVSKEGDEPHVPSADYRQVTVNLSKYAGKRCRVRLLFHQTDASDPMSLMMNNIRVLVDDVALGTPVQQDVSADFLHGNALVKPGEESIAKVLINNLGSEIVKSYDIELIDRAYDTVLSRFTGENLEPGDKKLIELGWSVSEVGRHDLVAKVHIQDDYNQENNESNILSIDAVTENCTTVNFNQGKELRSSAYPVEFGNVESATQSIYTAKEIGFNKACISSVVYTSAMDTPFKGESFEILIGETEKEDFSDGVFVDPKSLEKVFEGIVFFEQGIADVVIPFSEPYDYNGGNFVVMSRKLGKEFVNNREFIIHETENLRSIQASSIEEGGLGEYPVYHNVSAANVLPQMRLNITPYPAGSLSGKVKCGETEVSGVKVSIEGCALYVYTDTSGDYIFPSLAEGEYNLNFEKKGYQEAVCKTTVNAGEHTQLNMEIERVASHKVSGTITEAVSGKPLRGVEITLDGYDRYSAITDETGKFVINDVSESDDENTYVINTKSAYFENHSRKIEVSSDTIVDIQLNGSILRPVDVKAYSTDNGVKVEWTQPDGELRHDTGEYDRCLGYRGGWSEIIFGSAYRCNGKITEVSWYVTDYEGAHSNFNVYVFGLDSEGNPDPNNILYYASNVEYTDNAWTVHRLLKPVEAEEGFMAALSCDGFMGIGVTDMTDAYPFDLGMHYYAGDSFKYQISDMANFEKCHLMLRATVRIENEATRPTQKYNVYRIVDDAQREDWVLIGSTDEFVFTDDNVDSWEGSKLRYAVAACKDGKESLPVLSDNIDKLSKVEYIDNSIDTSTELNIMGDYLYVRSSSEVLQINIVNMSGAVVLSLKNPGEIIDVSSLAHGVYLATIDTINGSRLSYKLIKR